jgi:hypothetical protein
LFSKGERGGRAKPSESVVPADPKKELCDEVKAAICANPDNEDVEALPDGFGFQFNHGTMTFTVQLDNLFAETRGMDQATRRERIERFLSFVDETDKSDWEDVRQRLRLVLRSAAYGTVSSAGKYVIPVIRPFVPGLSRMAVVDGETSMALVAASDLEMWGVDADEVFAVAERNSMRLGALPELYDEMHGPRLTLPDDEYAASSLLLPGWLAAFGEKVEGRPLAIVPERATVFVGGDGNPEMVRALSEAAEREFLAAPRAISPAVYTVDDAGVVIPYQPEGSHPFARKVRRGHLVNLAHAYDEQAALLESNHSQLDVDLFVAQMSLIGFEDGRTTSYCVWPSGIEGLLPRAELICVRLSEEPNDHRFVPFERALEIGAGLWSRGEVPVGPERIRVSGVFSAQQIDAFRASAVVLEAFAK